MAYGSTGTGKTFTIMGPELAFHDADKGSSDASVFAFQVASDSKGTDHDDASLRSDQAGLLPRAAVHIFEAVSRDSEHVYTAEISYIQLYCERLQDLLAPEVGHGGSGDGLDLTLREDPEDGVYVEGATWVPVDDAQACIRLVRAGNRARAVAATHMNAHSSRSHAVFAMRVRRAVNDCRVSYC
jgi:kinesin family protein 5